MQTTTFRCSRIIAVSVLLFGFSLTSQVYATAEIKNIEVDSFSEGLALVCADFELCFYINKKGEIVIPPKYTSPTTYVKRNWRYSFFSDGLAVVSVGGKEGVIDKKGKVVVPLDVKEIFPFGEGLAAYRNGVRGNGYFDKSGEIAISLPKDFVFGGNFNEGLALCNSGDGFVFIDKTGKIAIPQHFEWANDFKEGLAAVKINGKWGFINKTGTIDHRTSV